MVCVAMRARARRGDQRLVAQIAHGLGGDAVDQLAPFGAVQGRSTLMTLVPDFSMGLAVFTWSSGQVEGQINRSTALKRSMFGRAGAELLRARMLPITALG
jgi:hypothetical protein